MTHLIIVDRYTRTDAQNNPDIKYCFGDNMKRVGLGGQAKSLRGESNAIGIPTLWEPGVLFINEDLEKVMPIIKADFAKAIAYIWRDRGIVVWPADGIGTGFADLQNAAPKIWKAVEAMRYDLFTFKGTRQWGKKEKAIAVKYLGDHA